MVKPMKIILLTLSVSASVILSCGAEMGNKAIGDANEAAGYRFGFMYEDNILCDPIYLAAKNSDHFALARKLGIEVDYQKSYFTPFPEGSLSSFISDKYNDTVTVIWSGGQFQAKTGQIGLYSDNCYTDWQCLLEPLETLENFPPPNSSIIVLPKGFSYDGPMASFKKTEIKDSQFNHLADSIKSVMSQTWQDWNREQNRSVKPILADRIIIECFGKETGGNPDTLFLNVSCYTGNSASTWTALFRLTKNKEGKWQTQDIAKPGMSSHTYRFSLSLDLNGDGTPEYLIDDNGCTSIIEIVDGELKILRSSNYRGC